MRCLISGSKALYSVLMDLGEIKVCKTLFEKNRQG